MVATDTALPALDTEACGSALTSARGPGICLYNRHVGAPALALAAAAPPAEPVQQAQAAVAAADAALDALDAELARYAAHFGAGCA